MRHFFVINPHSFKTLDELKQLLADLQQPDYTVYSSRFPRDAIHAVHRFLTGVDSGETARIYAVGGDGILFDCLNGMVGFPNAELTSVPYGNANDFVRAFGEEALTEFRDIKRLSAGTAIPVDIIHYGANYALNEANIGMGGYSTANAQKFLRKFNNNWIRKHASSVYILSAVMALFAKDVLTQKYRILMDGEDLSGSYINILVSNGPCNGGSLIPNPYAVPNDGLLDVLFTASRNRLQLIAYKNDYANGNFEKHKDIYIAKRCASLSVKSELPMHVELDGEAFFTQEIKIELIPKGIRFFVPKGFKPVDYSALRSKEPHKK
jgi:YegS/Rv2252/BmrU family lipid kinase